MRGAHVAYGETQLAVGLPAAVRVRTLAPAASPPHPDPLGCVAAALDRPHGAPPLEEVARGCRRVAIVVPDASRASAADVYLLPVLARLARAGLGPQQIPIVVARGIHALMPRAAIEALVGSDVFHSLRPQQSTPDTPGMNTTIVEDEALGSVRVHRVVADADLVVLTGGVIPHHLAGFGGGAKALVPGVAERDTVLAAHRLTLRTVVRPDGSVRSLAGTLDPNPFREALVRVARAFGRTWLLNVVLGDGGGIASAHAGDVEAAWRAAAEDWTARRALPAPAGDADLVVCGAAAPRDRDLVQAHKALLAALPFARPGAPIVWCARAPEGPGHARFLPWFEVRRLPEHLAALRRDFHPYGLTAYSVRRIAKDHPVLVVSTMDPDLLRPMGLLPFGDLDAALAHALRHHEVHEAVVLPDPA